MPHVAQSPEALLPRSDSKNPSTTCRGITDGGRPCRRPLAQSGNNVIRPDWELQCPESEAHIAAWYCWQHKGQASTLPLHKNLNSVRRQASLDTLVEQLGLLDVSDQRARDQQNREEKRFQRPERHQKSYSSGDILYSRRDRGWARPLSQAAQVRKPPSHGFLQNLFCFAPPQDYDYTEVVRHRKRVQGAYPSTPLPNHQQSFHAHHTSTPHRVPPNASRNPTSKSPLTKLLDFIPSSLPDKVSGDILQELLKPVSKLDKAGYIYIFWLTGEESAAPPPSLTSSLLKPDSLERPQNNRRTSDAIRDYANSSNGRAKTILLKIGRSNNVHRRMSEWSKQCGYNLNLVRFYPHQSSVEMTSESGSPHMPGRQIRMVPYAHKVERLIHLELAEKRVQQSACVTCKQVHREWFEIDASRKGLGAVDEAIKRWIRWAEQKAEAPQPD